MPKEPSGVVEALREQQRVIGRIAGDSAGPTLVAIGGIHGNEPAGVEACKRVLARLERERPPLRGDVVFLAGNLTALARLVRFVDLDLNRQWTPVRLQAVLAGGVDGAVEHREQRELLAQLREVVAGARGQVYYLDLHTCSAEGPPFITVGDTLRNRAFARTLPLPLILGLEEQVDGALLEYLNNFGLITLGVEGGRHDAPESVDCHEAVLWMALVGAGLLPPDGIAELDRYRTLLEQASRDAPRVVEVRHRHAIVPGDRFRMEPGLRNFQPVRKGLLLARNKDELIQAPEGGLILLPLYQGQGEDGFFISREVRYFWLKVSTLLRRGRLHFLMRFLPGVRRHPDRSEVLVVDTRIARLYPLEIFHLFGFRKLRRTGAELLVSRRCFDLEPPPRISM